MKRCSILIICILSVLLPTSCKQPTVVVEEDEPIRAYDIDYNQFFEHYLHEKPMPDEPIRAYDIDYNWGEGGAHGFARPGLWADADPRAHVEWYAALGCNVIQSFAVSCNGYAWYKNGIIPEQPGLKYDFLTEQVRLAHEKNIKVFGYFCIAANNKWEEDHPDLCYQMDGQQIPLTQVYLDYLCGSIKDAIQKTDMDGIFLDWFYNPGGGRDPLPPLRWLPCEQEMYTELLNQPFPGKENITPEQELIFRQKAIGRAWTQIRDITRQTKPDCLIWLSSYEVNSKEYQGNTLLKEIDWLMNEAGDTGRTQDMSELVGPQTKLITCLANWNGQNPVEVIPDAIQRKVGLYGFTKPILGSIMPPVDTYLMASIDTLKGDALNIAVLARTYNNLPLDYVKK